jgi:hypothetical protein
LPARDKRRPAARPAKPPPHDRHVDLAPPAPSPCRRGELGREK